MQYIHDPQTDIETDHVGKGQGSHRMSGAEFHGSINVFRLSETLVKDEDSFVNHGDQHPVYHKTGTILHTHWRFAKIPSKRIDGGVSLI